MPESIMVVPNASLTNMISRAECMLDANSFGPTDFSSMPKTYTETAGHGSTSQRDVRIYTHQRAPTRLIKTRRKRFFVSTK